MAICKDEDVCCDCILRRKSKDCGHEPFGWGPDMDGELGIGCEGCVTHYIINQSYFNDGLEEYGGIGEIIPWSLLYPIKIWYGMNWLFAEPFLSEGDQG